MSEFFSNSKFFDQKIIFKNKIYFLENVEILYRKIFFPLRNCTIFCAFWGVSPTLISIMEGFPFELGPKNLLSVFFGGQLGLLKKN